MKKCLKSLTTDISVELLFNDNIVIFKHERLKGVTSRVLIPIGKFSTKDISYFISQLEKALSEIDDFHNDSTEKYRAERRTICTPLDVFSKIFELADIRIYKPKVEYVCRIGLELGDHTKNSMFIWYAHLEYRRYYEDKRIHGGSMRGIGRGKLHLSLPECKFCIKSIIDIMKKYKA